MKNIMKNEKPNVFIVGEIDVSKLSTGQVNDISKNTYLNFGKKHFEPKGTLKPNDVRAILIPSDIEGLTIISEYPLVIDGCVGKNCNITTDGDKKPPIIINGRGEGEPDAIAVGEKSEIISDGYVYVGGSLANNVHMKVNNNCLLTITHHVGQGCNLEATRKSIAGVIENQPKENSSSEISKSRTQITELKPITAEKSHEETAKPIAMKSSTTTTTSTTRTSTTTTTTSTTTTSTTSTSSLVSANTKNINDALIKRKQDQEIVNKPKVVEMHSVVPTSVRGGSKLLTKSDDEVKFTNISKINVLATQPEPVKKEKKKTGPKKRKDDSPTEPKPVEKTKKKPGPKPGSGSKPRPKKSKLDTVAPVAPTSTANPEPQVACNSYEGTNYAPGAHTGNGFSNQRIQSDIWVNLSAQDALSMALGKPQLSQFPAPNSNEINQQQNKEQELSTSQSPPPFQTGKR